MFPLAHRSKAARRRDVTLAVGRLVGKLGSSQGGFP